MEAVLRITREQERKFRNVTKSPEHSLRVLSGLKARCFTIALTLVLSYTN